jgi:hypothetical protein
MNETRRRMRAMAKGGGGGAFGGGCAWRCVDSTSTTINLGRNLVASLLLVDMSEVESYLWNFPAKVCQVAVTEDAVFRG